MLFVFFTCFAKGSDWQAELAQAQVLLQQQKYQAAFNEYLKYAKQGNGLAEFSLALFYQSAWGREQDLKLACHWFKKSAHNKIPQAEMALANCYNQYNFEQKPEESINWYKKAFKSGISPAACALGKLFIQGKYIKQDVLLGVKWCEQGAKNGDINAQVELGRWYFTGELGKTNLEQAYYWLSGAAQQKNAEAAYYLAQFFEQGLGVNVDIEQARYWYELSASKGFIAAYLPTSALYWLEVVKDKNPSPEFLAKSYLWASAAVNTLDEKKDKALAQQLFNKIAKQTPQGWHKDLQKKVDKHLALYP